MLIASPRCQKVPGNGIICQTLLPVFVSANYTEENNFSTDPWFYIFFSRKYLFIGLENKKITILVILYARAPLKYRAYNCYYIFPTIS